MKPAAIDVRKTTLCLLLAAVLIGAVTEKPLEIRVTPHAVMAGGYMRVTCRVEPDERNRQLRMGIEGYRDSEFMLEGRDSKITFEVPYDHYPCGAGLPYCELTRENGRQLKVTEQVTVGGCEQSTSRSSYTTRP